MLQNTFIHVPGVSAQTETKIWQNDILTWHEFCQKHHSLILPETKKQRIHHQIQQSISAHEQGDHTFFTQNLPSNQAWRAYKELKSSCCFLDIETTGLSKHHNQITTIGLYNGKESKVFVQGQNLHLFLEEIKKYKAIVTFNGKMFDLPFLETKFPSLTFDQVHIDLRFALAQLGYRGGLKKIEKDLNVTRHDDLADMDGRGAVRLWYKYKAGDKGALELLKRYNIADVENLQGLMQFTYDQLRQKQFLNHLS